MVIAEHEKAGLRLVVKDDVTARDFEAWMKANREQRPKGGDVSHYEDLMIVLRGAIKAGLVVEPTLTVADVATLHPSHMRFYAVALNSWYAETTTIPLA